MELLPQLADALSRALHAPEPFANTLATDADGTLWSLDVGDELFRHVALLDRFAPAAVALLRERAREHLPPALHSAPAPTQALALYERYAAGELGVEVICDLEAQAVGDRPLDELDELIAPVAERVAASVRPEVRALLRAAGAHAVAIHVVTASLGRAVEATLVRAGIPFDRVHGGELRVREGRALAEMAVPCPLFEGKVSALERAGAFPAAMGLGDGGWDHVFLRASHVPVLVHPKPALRDAMRDVDRVVLLEGDARP